MQKYKITFQQNGTLKSQTIHTLDIEKEILPNNIITIKKINKSPLKYFNTTNVKKEEISNLFFELNMILKAKIPIYDALKILRNGTKNALLKEIISTIRTTIKNGKPIYKELIFYEKYLGNIVISFFKIAQENGNLEDCIYCLSVILKNIEENKKLITQKLKYPTLLLISLLSSIVIMFNFVIPKFEFIFEQYRTNLPLATTLLLTSRDFILNYFVYVLLFLSLCFTFIFIKYKNSYTFEYNIDKFISTQIPYISHIVFLNNFHKFFLSLKILLKANYKFQNSITNCSILIKNKYLLDRITIINNKIQIGKSISKAFNDSSLFDELTLRLINTGEKSNSLYLSINEIEKIYRQKLDEKIQSFSSIIEPACLLIIMLLIGWIVLAVLIPMWSIGEIINI